VVGCLEPAVNALVPHLGREGTTITVELVDVDATNWRHCAALRPGAEQERFVQPVTYYLSLCHYGQTWHPLAVVADGVVVGFVMWGVDDGDGSRWVGGFVVDASQQRRGYGRVALRLLVELLAAQPGCTGLALSYEPANTAARALYLSEGFVETGELEDDEVVARRPVPAGG
jgi:diamine N-acetyltransferase